MPDRSIRITQQGLGMDEGDQAELVDAWWNPPPAPPVTCPSTVPPASPPKEARIRRTLALDDPDELDD